MLTKDELGKKIRDLRVRKSISQGKLARGIGLKTHAAVSDIERGKTSVSVEQLDAIAQVLGVSVNDILEAEVISQGFNQNRDSSSLSANDQKEMDVATKGFLDHIKSLKNKK